MVRISFSPKGETFPTGRKFIPVERKPLPPAGRQPACRAEQLIQSRGQCFSTGLGRFGFETHETFFRVSLKKHPGPPAKIDSNSEPGGKINDFMDSELSGMLGSTYGHTSAGDFFLVKNVLFQVNLKKISRLQRHD